MGHVRAGEQHAGCWKGCVALPEVRLTPPEAYHCIPDISSQPDYFMGEQQDDRYYAREELEGMGFRKLGCDVLVSRTTRLYIPEYISIGDYSIIDDFCIVSGNVELGRNVHLAHGCRVIGGREGITMGDFSGLAFGVTIFAQSDDYSGEALTNPTVPMKFRKIKRARVEIGRHAIVGTGSVILPGVMLAEGSSVGSCSMVTKSTEPWAIYFGIPAKKIRDRRRNLLELEREYVAGQESHGE